MSTYQTVSRVLMSDICKDQHEALLKWCNVCAETGGSFAVQTVYADNWYQIYTINWPSRDVEASSIGRSGERGEEA